MSDIIASLDGLASMCHEYPSDPHNTELYGRIVSMCSELAYQYLRTDYYIPPTVGRMVYRKYGDGGNIHINRTVQEICSKGRSMDAIVSRQRVKDVRLNNFAFVIDRSDVITAKGMSRKIGTNIGISNNPEILEKIAAISILESIKKTADVIDVLTYGNDVKGPFNEQQYTYREMLLDVGKGANRLDLALARLLQLQWDRRPGVKHLIILTSGMPETGRMDLLDDIEVQESVLQYLNHMQKRGVRILYLPVIVDETFANKRVGSHSPRSFAQKIARIGIPTAELGDLQTLPDILRDGFKQMLSCRMHVALFE
ncbi:MAG: hypothetical protein P1P69_00450 [Methanosarcinaceae archaeon]|nr:hypothetical protein [Methanosarcinaceae archaeon]MDF1532961.1 hypothetical protein [Methanosarcinaceae archaeon]